MTKRVTISPVPFDEAILAMRTRGVELPDVYYGQMKGIERAMAFSVAGIAKADQLQQVLESLTEATSRGATFEQWKRDLLRAPDVLKLPSHRLDNIFRTNVQGAYARGKCIHIDENRDFRPYLRYSAINDSRVRPAHLAMDGHVAPIDDGIWTRWMPPAGYRCRCTVISLTAEQAKRQQEADAKRLENDPDAAMARAAAAAEGPDAGWDYSPCDHHQQQARIGSDRALPRDPRLEQRVVETRAKAKEIQGEDDPSLWKKIGGQKGSNAGGMYEATDGRRYYVKLYKDPNQARTEVAVNAIHRKLGIETPQSRIVEIDGQTAIASEWRDDFQRMSKDDLLSEKYSEDIARIFATSVMVKNWDVIGLDFDNVVLTKSGRLAVVDTGGSLDFRAQGAKKPYTRDIGEVNTLRDPTLNPQSAAVFNHHFDRDVWLEQAGARALLGIKRKEINEALLLAGFSRSEANRITSTMWARRKALLDRYKLTGARQYSGFGKHLAEFMKWGTARIDPDSKSAITEPVYLLREFEKYATTVAGKQAVRSLRYWFGEWSGSSNSNAAGLMKIWAQRRFGSEVGFHRYGTGSAGERLAEKDLQKIIKRLKTTEDKLFDLLDLEYEFHQYYLRRIHGWDSITATRWMSEIEYEERYNKAKRTYRPNAVVSTTVGGRFSNQVRVRFDIDVDDVLKSWRQGPEYMLYYDISKAPELKDVLKKYGNGSNEMEYIVIGRDFKVLD